MGLYECVWPYVGIGYYYYYYVLKLLQHIIIRYETHTRYDATYCDFYLMCCYLATFCTNIEAHLAVSHEHFIMYLYCALYDAQCTYFITLTSILFYFI